MYAWLYSLFSTPVSQQLEKMMFEKPNPEKAKSILESHTFDEIKSWRTKFANHPILHEAAEQSPFYEGALCILQLCWEDQRLRGLWNSDNYRDEYRFTVVGRLAMAYKNEEQPEFVKKIISSHTVRI